MTTGSIVIGTSGSNDFYSRVWSGADGKYRDNPYTLTFVEHHKRLGYYRSSASAPTCSLALSISPVHQTDPWTNNDDLALLGDLARQIKGHDFNLGTTAATSGQALNQAVSSIAALAKAMRSLKRGDIGGAARALGLTVGQRKRKKLNGKLNTGDISGAWLALQYGWLPTLSDTYEAWKAIEAHDSSREQKRTFHARRRRGAEKFGISNGVQYFSKATRRKSHTFTLSAELELGRELGLTDPLSILWEVMPWSFAIDWFLPIGAYLDALNIIPQLRGKGYTTSKLTVDTSSKYWATATPLNKGCLPPSYTRKQVSFSRDIVGGFDVPHPVFVSGLKGNRIYNAVALAHQLIR